MKESKKNNPKLTPMALSMALTFKLRYKLSPPCFFGLPDGDRVVVPAQPGGREVVGPILDTRTGQLVAHGTLSEYRRPEDILRLRIEREGYIAEFVDNFLTLSVNANTPQEAFDHGSLLIGVFCQAISAQFGERFSARFMSVETADGVPQRILKDTSLTILRATFFKIPETRDRVERAFYWAQDADSRAKKALLYFEHACYLHEFSQSFFPLEPHAVFSQALAFLQLYKALTIIMGEPGTDSDYQRRARLLGLPKDFWTAKVRPLYKVRNDNDVAHYSLDIPDPATFLQRFSEASTVFREVFSAYMTNGHSKDTMLES